MIQNNVQQHVYITKKILSELQCFSNNMQVVKSSKNTQIYSSLFQRKNETLRANSFLEFLSSERYEMVNKELASNKALFLDNSNVKYNFSDLNLNRSSKTSLNFRKRQFTLVAPQIISLYITDQLNKYNRLNWVFFKKSLLAGIKIFSQRFLQQFKDNVSGLKISCFGR